MKYLFILTVIVAFLQGCSNASKAKNETTAVILRNNDSLLIKLKGTRILMSHNLSDLFSDRTYEDSFLLSVPIREGIINGYDIPVRDGHFKFTGKLILEKDSLFLQLNIDDTSNKVLRKFSWNGEYKLIEKM